MLIEIVVQNGTEVLSMMLVYNFKKNEAFGMSFGYSSNDLVSHISNKVKNKTAFNKYSC